MGRPPILLGDKCKDCETVLTQLNCIYRGRYVISRCKNCYEIYMKQYSTGIRRRNYDLYRAYKITEYEYNELVKKQNGVCAICEKICNKYERLSVDHNHETNKVRGLLCHRCNSAIGFIIEDISLLEKIRD